MTLVADFNAAVNVPFQRMRQLLIDGALQEGVVGANDLKVVQRGAGANMSVDVGAGFAWVQIDTGTRNGMGHVTNDAVANVTVTASNGTNPRIDQIICRWNDSSIPTGSGNVPTLEVLTGTATAGATLDNRTGAAALPSDCLRLADLLIPTSSTSVVTANIRDRRPWARGVYRSVSPSTGTDYTTVSAVMADVDAALSQSVEMSGAPARVTFSARITHTADAAWVGGHIADTLGGSLSVINGSERYMESSGTGSEGTLWISVDFVPTAGWHTFKPRWATAAATATMIRATVPYLPVLVIEEIVRPNAANA